jgi:DNA-binding beta-propeller fold protein YncE
MPLRHLGYIALPPNRSDIGFDHADIHVPTDRLYVAHTSNDTIDVIDVAQDRYIESIPGFPGVAGALVCELRGLVFASNRGENTISIFAPNAERDAIKIAVGIAPNGLAFDPVRGILIVGNLGDRAIPNSYSVSVVDLARRERIAEIALQGPTRWTIYDAARETFFINVSSPGQIIAIDARDPAKIARALDVPEAGPHGLEFDPATGRLLCACDSGVLVAMEASSGRVAGTVALSGAPDVVFLDAQTRRLYVAVGNPGVIDVIDIDALRRDEVVPTERGAHTLAIDRKRRKIYAFLPRSHRAAVFADTD